MLSGREAALKAVAAWRKSGAWADNFLDHLITKENMDKREAALAARIGFGVIQNLYLCDNMIERFCTIGASKIEPMVRDILRISVYQIALMDKMPDHAVVSESVELAKKYAKGKAAGFVNGVLRNMLRKKNSLLTIEEEAPAKRLSIRYSHPLWLVNTFLKEHGVGGCEAI